MTKRVPRIIGRKFIYNDEEGFHYLVWCPGCKSLHMFNTVDPHRNVTWTFNGNLDSPTFSPSLVCYSTVHLCEGEHQPVVCPNPDTCGAIGHMILNKDWKKTDRRVLGHPSPHTRDPAYGNCHSFLRDGKWQFLADSAHELAGKTVDMVPLPKWVRGED